MATIILRVCAGLIGLRGNVNLFKSLGAGDTKVPLIGAVMIALAVGLWLRRRWALPLAVGSATFATLNILLFPLVSGLHPPVTGARYALFVLGGIAITWGAVSLRRGQLGVARR